MRQDARWMSAPQSLALASKTGLLLVNLGTPDEPDKTAVRRYLQEFLSDPRVIDIHPAARWLLLNFAILPFRPAKSAKAYKEIWTERGSPLMIHSKELTDAVRRRMPELEVELAMRYGNPSIAAGMEALRARGCDRLIVFPLYPQYASSSTGTAVEAVYREAANSWNTPYITIVPPFYDHPDFIQAQVAIGRPILNQFEPDHVMFSFHGLPVRHVVKSAAPNSPCSTHAQCCDAMTDANRNCYRAQCFATARAMARNFEIESGQWSVAFQSRLGRTPWIQPYTEESLTALAKAGTKRVAVFCPAFVADCLETIEEIGMRAKEDFIKDGGEDLRLIPSLNAHPKWVDAVVKLTRESSGLVQLRT